MGEGLEYHTFVFDFVVYGQELKVKDGFAKWIELKVDRVLAEFFVYWFLLALLQTIDLFLITPSRDSPITCMCIDPFH